MRGWSLAGALSRVVLTVLLLFGAARLSCAMDGEFGAFQRIMLMPLQEQAQLADAILRKKYETSSDPASYENYMGYAIPFYALASDLSFAGYRIAAVKPDLLARFELYDACGEATPRTVLECFLEGGKPGEYVDVAASCQVCSAEAVTLFLWDEAGLPQSLFIGGLRFLYDPSLHEGPPL